MKLEGSTVRLSRVKKLNTQIDFPFVSRGKKAFMDTFVPSIRETIGFCKTRRYHVHFVHGCSGLAANYREATTQAELKKEYTTVGER